MSESYSRHYDLLLSSGLYEELVAAKALIPHREVDAAPYGSAAHRIIQPDVVPFISYPYEWSHSQLKDAALLTLEVQQRALDRGMVLKDASAFNVQFMHGRPVLIDTLSFQCYVPGTPWIAYRQFCQHFLVPLVLMSYVDVRLSRLLQTHLDGIPLDLGARLLPARTLLKPGPLLHIHLHARSLARHANDPLNAREVAPRMSIRALRGLIDSLQSMIRGLRWNPEGTEWADYDSTHAYTAEAEDAKAALLGDYLAAIRPRPETVWDLGANTGTFSRIAAQTGARVISFDIDPAAVERNYLDAKQKARTDILPLVLDLTNPSPAVGWANSERSSWTERSRPDVVMALALLHHLAIGNNVPLGMIADLLGHLAPYLIVEFVPKHDPQVRRLLGSREDIFADYSQAGFEAAFGRVYRTVRSDSIPSSDRRLYLMERASTVA